MNLTRMRCGSPAALRKTLPLFSSCTTRQSQWTSGGRDLTLMLCVFIAQTMPLRRSSNDPFIAIALAWPRNMGLQSWTRLKAFFLFMVRGPCSHGNSASLHLSFRIDLSIGGLFGLFYMVQSSGLCGSIVMPRASTVIIGLPKKC